MTNVWIIGRVAGVAFVTLTSVFLACTKPIIATHLEVLVGCVFVIITLGIGGILRVCLSRNEGTVGPWEWSVSPFAKDSRLANACCFAMGCFGIGASYFLTIAVLHSEYLNIGLIWIAAGLVEALGCSVEAKLLRRPNVSDRGQLLKRERK
jgi:hypothetical protein